jgi:hypothetical protein
MSGLYPKTALHHSQQFQFRLKFSPLKSLELMERETGPSRAIPKFTVVSSHNQIEIHCEFGEGGLALPEFPGDECDASS